MAAFAAPARILRPPPHVHGYAAAQYHEHGIRRAALPAELVAGLQVTQLGTRSHLPRSLWPQRRKVAHAPPQTAADAVHSETCPVFLLMIGVQPAEAPASAVHKVYSYCTYRTIALRGHCARSSTEGGV